MQFKGVINMVDFTSSFQDILEEYKKHKINMNYPGFYDEPNFIKLEKSDSNYLETYASYVQLKNYSAEYLNCARTEIPCICEVLYQELASDGRLGACIDASMVLSRILEKEGFWNYVVKGSLTIEFPPQLNIETKYFWTFDIGDYKSAHTWVVAPPFNIIDITIKQQKYNDNGRNYLPNYIFKEEINNFTVSFRDLFSPNIREQLRAQGIRNSEMITHVKPRLEKYWQYFKPNLVDVSGTKLKYTPTGIGAPDSKLEHIKSLKLNNRYGIDIYNNVVKPMLSEMRS